MEGNCFTTTMMRTRIGTGQLGLIQIRPMLSESLSDVSRNLGAAPCPGPTADQRNARLNEQNPRATEDLDEAERRRCDSSQILGIHAGAVYWNQSDLCPANKRHSCECLRSANLYAKHREALEANGKFYAALHGARSVHNDSEQWR